MKLQKKMDVTKQKLLKAVGKQHVSGEIFEEFILPPSPKGVLQPAHFFVSFQCADMVRINIKYQ